VWRLILDGPGSGTWNMGMDEALLASAVAGGPPTLRLYRWQGPWLSLGYGQCLSKERAERCQRAGVGVVRRVTGGRAVLHGGDLTYTVAAHTSALPDGLSASYAAVCRGLLAALDRIGVRADSAPVDADRGPIRDFDCFAHAAEHEVCVLGKKLAGSAQRRATGGVLQHGSIRLVPDPSRIVEACGLSGGGATSLFELGHVPEPGALEQACADGFSAAFGCRLTTDVPTENERLQASARVEDPPGTPDLSGPPMH
jgi:lipoate-protein ligase A